MAKAKRRRARKKRIKEDSFVTLWIRALQYSQAHYIQITLALVAMALAVGFLLFAAHTKRAALQESGELLGRGIGQYRRGDMTGARKTFEQVAENYPRLRTGAIATYFKAECDLYLGDYAEASSAFEEYLRKADKYPFFRVPALIGKALALEGASRYREAALLLEEALEELDRKDPRYTDVAYRAANYLAMDPETRPKGIELYQEIAREASGKLKTEAQVAATLLKGQ